MTAEQLDLFAEVQTARALDVRAPAIPERPFVLPSVSWEWDEILTRAAEPLALRIHVSRQWAGVVLEQIVDRRLGRRILWHKGQMTCYPAPPAYRPTRTVHMTADAAEAIHRQHPLVRHSWGEGWVQYRPAGPDDTPTNQLQLPEGIAA